MKVRTFRARSMGEALALVKRTFGGRAVIIHTKNVRAPGLSGFFGRQIVEIAAASDNAASPTLQGAPTRDLGVPAAYREQARPKQPTSDDQLTRLREEIAGIRTTLDDMVRSNCPPTVAGLPEPLTECYTTLLRRGVDEALAAEVVRSVADEASEADLWFVDRLRERITGRLAEHVKVAGPVQLAAGRCRVVALVGPTGVGKTTTIAKLAANSRVRAQRRVALITIDTYRIAAVQQLRTIADIIKVPLRTVLTVGDLRAALNDLRGYELVLIDTAGRSQRDEMKMSELKSFMAAASPDEVHLVVSATGSTGNVLEVIKRFSDCGPNRLLLTKLDEAEALGRLVSVSSRSDVPVSYLTTGQDIPDDIELASANRLGALVWER